MSEMLTADSNISHYRIISKIGAGGMGEVYLAHDTTLNRRVALKVLPADLISNRERLHRFEQEARAASALNHPNIITIHEIGAEADTHFIATEFIEGETLWQRLQTARVEIAETLNIAIQIAAALDAAHRSGIVHRDIKPENVMLRADGLVKVLDFGLAKLTEKQDGVSANSQAPTRAFVKTLPGAVMGTVAYMSPEQARGLAVDARTDVFSLGVVLYEMLAGGLPFAGETASDMIAAILTGELAPLDETTPLELQRIVRKSLQKNADERYQTVKDLLIDLKALKQGQDFTAELKRSSIPTRADQSVPTQDQSVRTTSSAEYIASGVRQRKGIFTVVLAILLLATLGLGYWFYNHRATNRTPIESIAVLPFINEGGNADVEYLSDGMTETLISSLSQLPKLNVKARSSVFRYKGKDTNAWTIGRELNVQAILMGRVVQRGEQLTLYLELVDAQSGNRIWGEQYNRKLKDLITLQSDIARDVSQKLKTKFLGPDEQPLAKNYTGNVEAYQLYLKGRFYWNKRTVSDFRRSIEYLQQAIAADPNYALAYAALANSYASLSNSNGAPPREVIPKARQAALKALSLDERLVEAHIALGIVLCDEYDFAGAEREYKHALELNPNDATAHLQYGWLLTFFARHEEALAEDRRALEIEPLSLSINRAYGDHLLYARRYDESIAQLKKTLDLDANFETAHNSLGYAYWMNTNYAESVEEFAKRREAGGSQQLAALVRESFAKGGWAGFLQMRIGEFRTSNTSSYAVAIYRAALGEKDEAFAELNKAYENREFGLELLKVDPRLDPLRSDPRFAELMRKVGLPQ